MMTKSLSNIKRWLMTSAWVSLLVLNGCTKDESTGPDTGTPNVAQYAGVWTGTTDQRLPVYFRITSSGVVDSLTIRIRMEFPTFTCTATFNKDTTVSVQGNSFVARVKYAGSTNIITRVRATLSSASSSQGSYDGYGGSFSLVCGSTFATGFTSTIIDQGTWTATKQ